MIRFSFLGVAASMLVVTLLCPVPSFSQVGSPPALHSERTRSDRESTRDESSLRLLRAVDYAALTRIVTLKMCQRKPEMAARLPACSTIATVPSAAIERMVLPHFNRYVSPADVKSALTFWASATGAKINKTMLREIAEDNPTLLTPEESRLLDGFNKSEAGRAMSRLAKDRDVSQAVIRAIGAYVS